jgi:hypothetical protein
MLGKLILAEERCSGRFSALRIFCRIDVSVFRDCSGDVDLDSDSGFKYVVNEVDRTLNTCLYYAMNKPGGAADMMFVHLSKILLSAVQKKLLLNPPPPPPVRQAPV